jgi:hypothetical protein
MESPQTDGVIAEVQKYAVELAKEKDLAKDLVLLAAGTLTLPVKIVARAEHKASIPEAEKRIINATRTMSNSCPLYCSGRPGLVQLQRLQRNRRRVADDRGPSEAPEPDWGAIEVV